MRKNKRKLKKPTSFLTNLGKKYRKECKKYNKEKAKQTSSKETEK